MNIAVVDDERVIKEQICSLIKKKNPEYHLEAYDTGGELLAAGKRFDLVFLDIQMDGMNGIETKFMRQWKNWKDSSEKIFTVVTGHIL